MKKSVFVFLLCIEIFADLIAMGLLFSDAGALIYLIAAAVFAAVLIPCFVRLKKEPDELKKKKIRRNMILIMLLPMVVALLIVAAVVVSMILYFE